MTKQPEFFICPIQSKSNRNIDECWVNIYRAPNNCLYSGSVLHYSREEAESLSTLAWGQHHCVYRIHVKRRV